MHAERITDVIAYHMEGPCWWPGWGGLRFVDMLAGEIVRLEPDGHTTRVSVGKVAACVRPRSKGASSPRPNAASPWSTPRER